MNELVEQIARKVVGTERVWKWKCNICEKPVTEDQATSLLSCPHCDCTWCGDECCGVYAMCYQE